VNAIDATSSVKSRDDRHTDRRNSIKSKTISYACLAFVWIALLYGDVHICRAGWLIHSRHRKAARLCRGERAEETPANRNSDDSKSAIAVEAHATLIEAGEFSDGGTFFATVKLASGEELSFGVSSPDCKDELPPNRLYAGHMDYSSPAAHLVTTGSDEEKRLINALENALRPFCTKEAERKLQAEMREFDEKSGLPPHPPVGPPPFGVAPAKILLNKMKKLVNKQPAQLSRKHNAHVERGHCVTKYNVSRSESRYLLPASAGSFFPLFVLSSNCTSIWRMCVTSQFFSVS
jgi:hypothetical protein